MLASTCGPPGWRGWWPEGSCGRARAGERMALSLTARRGSMLAPPTLGDRPNPASTLLQVAALARPEFLVEVEAVVAVPD